MRGLNATRWDDHQKKKIFVNIAKEVVIPLKKDHQGLLRLHVPLESGGGFKSGKRVELPRKEGIFAETEKSLLRRPFRNY